MTMSSLDIQSMVGIMQRIEKDEHIPVVREWLQTETSVLR